MVGGRRPLSPKMGDRSDPHLSKITNAIFNGLRFEVEQASRGLSAIAEILVFGATVTTEDGYFVL